MAFSKTHPRLLKRGNRFCKRYTGKILEKFIQRPAMLDVVSKRSKWYPGPAKNGLAAQYSRVADDHTRCHVISISFLSRKFSPFSKEPV